MSRSLFSRSPRNSTPSNSSHGHTRSQFEFGRSTSSSAVLEVPSRSSGRLPVHMRGMSRLEQRRSMEETHFLKNRARERNFNPPVDLRLLDYASAYDDNLMCPICRCPFVDPVVLAECDHCFCRECIRQCWNTESSYTPLGPRGVCPTCRTPAKLGPRSATSKILVNIVDELMVKCPQSELGCKAEVKRGEVQNHVNLYCGYALVECPAEDCEQPVRRKDLSQGCLHYRLCCVDCHTEMQKWQLDAHWRIYCPDRRIVCELCKDPVFYRDLEEHNTHTCPAISVLCPGHSLGCNVRSKVAQAEAHQQTCILASLAPVIIKQQERLDEQEAAQKLINRKVEVLERSFSAMENILYPSSPQNPDRSSADERNIPFLRTPEMGSPLTPTTFDIPAQSIAESGSSAIDTVPSVNSSRSLPSRASPDPLGPRPTDLPEPLSTDFDLDGLPSSSSAFPPPVTNGGPYASPLHHLLSMHESLRDELSRVSAALSELDGRHSMQNLNENMRTREEITYLGAQVGGLQRQVHWLTSAQLQRQQRGSAPSVPTAGGSADPSIAVDGVVGAVSSAATALRGAARAVRGGQQSAGREGTEPGMRRGYSEEGRTKL